MNIKQLIAATAAVFVTGSVFAQQTYPYVDFSGFQGTKTRAEVMQELQASQANGNYVVGGHEYVDRTANFVSSKTRAQVMAEMQQSEGDGSYALAHQEYVEPAVGFASTKPHVQVVAELWASEADGSYALAHQEYDGQFPRHGRNTGTWIGQSGAASNVN